MNRLFELGINEEDIKFMLERCSSIFDISEREVIEKIDILKYIGCSLKLIKQIIVSNPEYLDRSNEDILNLISYLKYIGINDVVSLFGSNPYFLNLDVYEISDYINNRLKDNVILDDIIDEILDNPYIIDEI